MGFIYYLMGKSASGKDTLYRELLKLKPGLNTYLMYTTRPRRDGEINGRDYYFIDEKIIEKFIKEGRLIESRVYNTVHGPWTYATVDDGQIDLKKGSYLSMGTPESFIRLKEYFGVNNVIPIYIEVEDGDRLIRAIMRERRQNIPDYRELCRRFLSDCRDFSDDKLKEAGIRRRFINDSIDRCLDEIIGVME